MRLIDADALPTSIENMDLEVAEKIVERWMQDAPCDISWDAVRVLRDFYDEVKDAPTIDAVKVVRCKDCKWFGEIGCAIRIVDDSDKPKEDDYCSFAERRTDDANANT